MSFDPELKCAVCGAYPCGCAEELKKLQAWWDKGNYGVVREEVVTEVKTISYQDFILSEAVKQTWPGNKMTAAKLLNELAEK